MVQWLRLHTPNAGDLVRFLIRELRVCMLQLRPRITKYINKYFLKNKDKYKDQKVNSLRFLSDYQSFPTLSQSEYKYIESNS